jgi:hypothetical protein
LPKLSKNLAMDVEEEADGGIDEPLVNTLASDLGDVIVRLVNAKKGVFGTVNLFVNGERLSSVNFE